MTEWQEGRDGETTLYRERLFPAWWVFVVVFGFVGMLAIAFGSALGAAIGYTIAIGGILVASLFLLLGAPVIAVDDRVLRAGRARLPRSVIGRYRALDADETTKTRDHDFDARWFTVLRPWSTSTAVIVEVTDPNDPHPAWLISARRPHRVVAALDSSHV